MKWEGKALLRWDVLSAFLTPQYRLLLAYMYPTPPLSGTLGCDPRAFSPGSLEGESEGEPDE